MYIKLHKGHSLDAIVLLEREKTKLSNRVGKIAIKKP